MPWLDNLKTWVAKNKPYSPQKLAAQYVDQANWHFLYDTLRRAEENPTDLALAIESVKARTAQIIKNFEPHHLRHFRDIAQPYPALMDHFVEETKNAIPAILHNNDFSRFNCLYLLSQENIALAEAFSPFIIARAATAMRDKGYPLQFEFLQNLGLHNSQLHNTFKRIGNGVTIDTISRNNQGTQDNTRADFIDQQRLSVIFTEKGVLCQDEQMKTGGMKPIEMVSHWRNVAPHEADRLSLKLEQILQNRALRGLRSAKEAYNELKSLDAV